MGHEPGLTAAATSAPAPDGAPLAGAPFARWRVFPPIALGVIMATLDASIVNIALPTLQRTFAAPFATVEWVALAYSLTVTALLLSSGRLADARGRRGVYAAGLVLFTLASLACGLAPAVGWLIALRALQGVGAALVSANGSALLVAAFPAGERGRALGAFGAMVGVGLAVGPPLGGALVAHASWRWIFLLNVPLGMLALAMLRSRVPADPPREGAPGIALLPTALWAGGLIALMLALSRGSGAGWMSGGTLALFVAALVLFGAFALGEARSRAPLLPLGLLVGPLGAAVALTFFGILLSVAVGFHMPLVLEEVAGYDAAASGAWLAVLPGAALLCAPIAGRLADRFGARPLTVLGMALTAVGLWLLAGLGPAPSAVRLVEALGLVGVGQGLFTVPNASALLSLVPPSQLGLAVGLQGTTRNLGIAAGIALTGAVVASRYAAHGGGVLHVAAAGGVARAALVAASRDAFRVLAAIALLATWLAWWARRARAPVC